MVTDETIEVFADVWCPFTHVGLVMLANERQRRNRGDVRIVVRSWPLEIINGAPMDPDKVRSNCEALRAQVSPDQFSNVNLDHFPTTTLDALDLVAQAYAWGGAAGERASFAVRAALFEAGEDIGRIDVLQRIASEIGFVFRPDPGHVAVHADLVDGRERGVVGSPHFFHGDDGVFCPSLRISRDTESRLVVEVDVAAFEEFIGQIFD